jgi:hypothetical protein
MINQISVKQKKKSKNFILFSIVSFSEEMGQRLDDYCDKYFGDLVRILRAPTRLGLIKAKNYGAKNGLFLFVLNNY